MNLYCRSITLIRCLQLSKQRDCTPACYCNKTFSIFSLITVKSAFHRRSLKSGRSVPRSLPPCVGQRGRPRVAGGERNTTPRPCKKEEGVLEREHEVTEWKKRGHRERSELALVLLFLPESRLLSGGRCCRCPGGLQHATPPPLLQR